MTSKPQSMTTVAPLLIEAVKECFTTHEYNDLTGAMTLNMADAMFAIANAVNRLAVSQENLIATQREAISVSRQHTEMMMTMLGADRPGHA